MSAPAIPLSVLLASLDAMEQARIALCLHPETADVAMQVARAKGTLQAHVEHALPANIAIAVRP